MSSTSVTEIVCAHSPDSDDAFMFYGLATKKVRTAKVSFRHVLEDIETLNRKATEGRVRSHRDFLSRLSYVADKYVLMASGSSIGDGYGPMLVSIASHGAGGNEGQANRDSRQADHALIWRCKLFQPDFEAVVDSLRQDPGCGARARRGRGPDHPRRAVDLRQERFPKRPRSGPMVEGTYDLPLPLGANALLRSLPEESKANAAG